MDSRAKLAIAVLFMALSLFAVAGVLGYKYVKAAQYVCYYGAYAPGSYDAVVGLGPAGAPVNGSFFSSKGVWSNPDDIRCLEISEESFVCPAKYGGEQKYLGVIYATRSSLGSFVDKT